MINAIYKIGKVLKKEYPEYFQPWMNPFPRNEEQARVITISVENGIIKYPIDIDYFKPSKVEKYLYRKVLGANGTNLVPTFLFQYETKEEKLRDSIRKVLKKVKASLKNYKHDCIDAKQINDELAAELSKLPYNKDNRYLLTFKIDGNYFGDFQKYLDLFEKEAFDKYRKKSSATNKLCAITYEHSKEVWGRIDTLGFTVNDKPFNRNGFNEKDSYKMFPVSPDAVKILEGASKLVFQKFSNNFYGMKYFILPHFITDDEEIMEEVLTTFIEKNTAIPLTGDESKSIIGNERILNQIIKEEKLGNGAIYYDIFFYQPNNAQFLIKLHLSDVLPSQLKRIFETKNGVEKRYRKINQINIPKKGKKEAITIPFYINFRKIKEYFSKKVKTDTIFHPYFFKILESVFYNNSLNESQILKAFVTKIQSDFKNRNEYAFQWQQSTKESFSLYQFFYQLKLFKNQPDMENNHSSTVALTYESFLNQHQSFFKDDFLKGVFALACVTEKLLEKQYKKYDGNQPFYKNLNGLNLDEKQIRKILPKLTNKINEFKRETNTDYKLYANEINYINDLSAQAANGLLTTTSAGRTDISYVFSLGMIMQKEFTKQQIMERKAESDRIKAEKAAEKKIK